MVDGIMFDSKKEAYRYGDLKMLERGGVIKDLVLQPEFVFEINGKPLKTNVKNSKQLRYIADFQYFDNEKNMTIVEDVKSTATKNIPVFKYKQALMWTLYGIDIFVV